MGYSHSYRLLASALDKMPEISATFEKVVEMLPETAQAISGPFGFGAPRITSEKIVFNGDAGRGEDFEEFYFAGDCPMGKDYYCKTGRRPYDLAVCLCLIILKDILRDRLKFRSDGTFLPHRRKDGSFVRAEGNWTRARWIYYRYCRLSGKDVPDYYSWGIDEK